MTSVPYDELAERAVLGSILLSPGAAIVAMDVLSDASMFWVEKHAWIFEAVQQIVNRGAEPDLVTIPGALGLAVLPSGETRLETIGGYSFLLELANVVPTPTQVAEYARRVLNAHTLRGIIKAASDIARVGGVATDAAQAAEEAQRILNNAIDTTSSASEESTLGECASALYEMIQRMQETAMPLTGIPTCFHDLDKYTGGLQKSDLIILAARPSVGKTSLALNIAEHAAHDAIWPNGMVADPGPVLIFSLEMSKRQLTQRFLATMTGVDMEKIRKGTLHDSELQLVIDALGKMSSLNIVIDDGAALSIAKIRAKARRYAQKHGAPRLIIVDYLQLMISENTKDNRVTQVSAISRGLKILAREMDCPVIALSQLSRSVESRVSKVPMLSDLRESGSIEADADQVWFIYREELYDSDTDKKGIAEIHVSKNRNGPIGIVPLRFFPSTTRFANLETYRQPEGF